MLVQPAQAARGRIGGVIVVAGPHAVTVAVREPAQHVGGAPVRLKTTLNGLHTADAAATAPTTAQPRPAAVRVRNQPAPPPTATTQDSRICDESPPQRTVAPAQAPSTGLYVKGTLPLALPVNVTCTVAGRPLGQHDAPIDPPPWPGHGPHGTRGGATIRQPNLRYRKRRTNWPGLRQTHASW